MLFLSIPLLSIICSCNSGNKTIPDISNIHVSLETYRFDKDLFDIDTNNVAEGLKKLQVKYPDFLNYYLDTVREFNIHGNFNDTVQGIREYLRLFLTFKDYTELQDTIEKHYPHTKEIDEQLTDGFRYLKYYFPEVRIPRIIYMNMGLSRWPSFPVDKGTMCIGLDMFLGDQYPFYKSIAIPYYMLSHCRKTYIPVSLFSSYYRMDHPFEPDDKTLLDLMLQRGREQYFLHKILPHHPDSVLFGFTKLQLEWCAENEALIYNFFIRQNLLFNKEPQAVMPYVHDGPFAKGLEAADNIVKVTPGNVGTWLGYKIVSSYMQQCPEKKLSDLLNNHTEPSRFLDSAKYKPR